MTGTENGKSAGPQPGRHPRRSRHGVWVILGAALLLTALVVVGIVSDRVVEAAAAHGRFGHGEWSGERGEALLSGALRWIGADDAQRERALAVHRTAHAELEPLMEQHRARVAAFREALLAPEIDRAALEELRRQELALADEASQLLLESIADLGDVLTPEQRRELAALASHGRRWRH